MIYTNSLTFAQNLDRQDPLSNFRQEFYLPQHEGKDLIYFNGNSLGLQPRKSRNYLEEEMLQWERLGVEGHFEGRNPWFDYHKCCKKALAEIVGASESEVTPMNSLTVNLHLLWVSFYQPQGRRNKILMEAQAFPSDQYVAESQAKFHGLDPEEVIVEIYPRPGEYTIQTEDILAKIDELGDELALVFLGGVNYYTGQFFELSRIAEAGHKVGAFVGFDLAHTVGNLPLALHNWQADFAAWCSYKYLNSGPGGIAGIFVHKKHLLRQDLPRFNGWWGYEEQTRFQMRKGFIPEPSVDAWQLSNVPIMLLAGHRAALDIFAEAGMHRLREKSVQLTGYLEYVIQEISLHTNFPMQIITPTDPEQRGCQLSLIIPNRGRDIFEFLQKAGIRLDWREPDVMRLAPAPLYNTFEEVYRLGERLEEGIRNYC
ncbi:MAG: kynureninase [Microscillaceae bacterium]|nr:kynureninase [Microscillaceae bacterium]